VELVIRAPLINANQPVGFPIILIPNTPITIITIITIVIA
jgi:hypothetical protein